MIDGINLPPPEWLPTEFPLPNGISIRHINNQLAGGEGGRFLTGFIPGGDPGVVVAGFGKNLRAAGYEILFAAEGEVPEFTEAVVALHEGLKNVVGIDVSKTDLPVRVSSWPKDNARYKTARISSSPPQERASDSKAHPAWAL